MASNVLIGSWATGIWVNLGSPSSVAVTTISGYALQPSTLGRLNDLIGTCYSGSGFMGTGQPVFDTVPDITSSELALVEQMYLGSYYAYLSTAVMGISADTIPWTNIGEGDSRISRANGVTAGKEYREWAKDANGRLNYLVNAYLNNAAGANTPRSVTFYNPPTWAYYGGGYDGRHNLLG